MRKLLSLVTVGLLAAAAGPAEAALLISEVLYNEVSSPVGGEWVEIYNTGPGTVDLSNYKIGDEENQGGDSENGGMFQFPSGSSIGPGVVQVVAGSADRFFEVYGFLPTYEVTGANSTIPNLSIYASWDPGSTELNMANSSDQAILLGPTDGIVDAVSWGNAFAFDPGLDGGAETDGQSYERINALVDTDTAADWQLGNLSSPGTVAIPEPATVVLGALACCGMMWSRRRSSLK